VFKAIDKVRQCLIAGFKAQEEYPDRVMTVVYEKLVDSPEKVIKEICAFLEIDWQPAMTKPGTKNHMGEQAITVKSGELWYNKASYNRNPDRQSIDAWKTDLTVRQQFAVVAAFEKDPKLKELGYDLSLPDVSPFHMLVGRVYVLQHRLSAKVARIAKAKLLALD